MRPAASKFSADLAKKEKTLITDHPLFKINNIKSIEKDQEEFLKNIKDYKPLPSKKLSFISQFNPVPVVPKMPSEPEKKQPEIEDKKVKEDIIIEKTQIKAKSLPKLKKKRKSAEKSIPKTSFKDSVNYVSYEPIKSKEELRRLWGGEEPIDMNELVVEVPGDANDDLLKPEKKRKWDRKKKRYVNAYVDPDGNIIKDSKVNKKKEVKKLKEKYNKWNKQTHVRIQAAGEEEDAQNVEHAKNSFWTRKDPRRVPQNQSAAVKSELKSPEQILKAKKKYVRDKKRSTNNPAKKFARANRKIAMHSAPSRSKMISRR